MNTVVDYLAVRKSGRSFSEVPVAEEIILELIEAVRLSPSCKNNQPAKFIFMETNNARGKASEAFTGGNRAWAPKAPLIAAGYTRREDDCIIGGREYHQFDLGLAAMNLMLAATARGLMARPMAGFEPAKIKQLFNLDETCEPLVMIAIGYESEDESHLPENYRGLGRKPRVRKPAHEFVKRL